MIAFATVNNNGGGSFGGRQSAPMGMGMMMPQQGGGYGYPQPQQQQMQQMQYQQQQQMQQPGGGMFGPVGGATGGGAFYGGGR